MIMILSLIKLLMVWVPSLALTLRLWPAQGPGRWAFCFGLSGVWSLLLTGLMMWAIMVTTGSLLHWVPIGVIALVAVLVLWFVPGPTQAIPRTDPAWGTLSPPLKILVVILVGMIVLRFVSLLPDVTLRPLTSWDAWTVWAYEARVWFEQGRYVEFLPPQAVLSAPAEQWVRLNVVEYPRLIPALMLWISVGEGVWNGVGPGLLWWFVAASVGLMIFGALRLIGLALPWALTGAYAWLSLPMINAHMALYGYADLWMAAAMASFATGLLLAERADLRAGWGLALASLMVMPFIKVEGVYWLCIGVAAVGLSRLQLPPRVLVAVLLLGIVVLWAASMMDIDLIAWLTIGRLSLGSEGFALALQGAARHAFFWYDWHFLFYLLFAVLAVALLKPRTLGRVDASFALALLALAMLWVLTPYSGAGEWFQQSTLFSRIAMHVSAPFVLFVLLSLHQIWDRWSKNA